LIATPFESAKKWVLRLKSGSLRMVTPHFYGLISVSFEAKELFFEKKLDIDKGQC
jgi:hypothetical protein